MRIVHSGSSGVRLSKTSCVSFSQLLVDFDTAVRSGSRSTSLPESPEARANWRERVWPLTSAHWLIAATVCPTVLLCVCSACVWARERKCACVSLYIILLHTILFLTLHPSHRKCVVLSKWSCILALRHSGPPKTLHRWQCMTKINNPIKNKY